MGCAASKLENEDTVRRCKDRRRLIKAAVVSRHQLAAAHSDYCRSLRLTGSSLSSFSLYHPHLSVSPHTPSVLLPPSPSPSPPIPPRHVSPPHPPIPTRHVSPPPIPPATSSSSYRRTFRKPKLPHILSESSPSATPRSRNPNNFPINFTYKADLNNNYSETQSQTDGNSSVWNWENFYPPSPPGSEYFDNKQLNPNKSFDKFDKSSVRSESFRTRDEKLGDDKFSVRSESFRTRDEKLGDDKSSVRSEQLRSKSFAYKHDDLFERRSSKGENYNYKQQQNNINNNDIGYKEDGGRDRASVYSDFFDMRSKKDEISNYRYRGKGENGDENHHLEVDEEGEETEREEVQYSEWDDHYNTTTTSSSEGDERERERESSSRSGIRAPSEFGSSFRTEQRSAKADVRQEKVFDDCGSSVSWNNNNYNKNNDNGEVTNEMGMVVRHRDLAEIVAAIREYFDKAASAGEQVAEMLETGRAQMDRSFSKLKKTVYHSSGIFTNLSSSWTSKPPLAVKYQFEPSSIVEPGGSKSLCSTLERLLAWEKKLYQEVKAREGVKIENEKKLSSLQSQEYRGDNEVKLDKTKSEIKRLQSLIVVTSQAVSTTSSAIIGVRDAELVPQLVELCHGFMYMWRSMNQFHEVQNQIVQQVRGLVNQSTKGESTSDLHRQATRDLESAVSAWHSSFCRLIKFQRDFICNLHGWFKLTLLPLNTEPFNGNIENSEAFSFYDEWKLALERVPDTVASEAIKSFINVVHSISLKQTEELKIKKRTELVSKELEKKSNSLRNIEKKYYHSYSMVGIGLPDTGPDNGHVLDARDPLSEKKIELESCRRRVEDEMLRHSKSVEVTRAMTLNNIQTGLPGVFQAMTSFSALIMEALEAVCTRSYAIK